MVHIIGARSRADVAAQLVSDPHVKERIERAVVKAVRASFRGEAAECERTGREFRPTRDEVRRRAGIAYEWFSCLVREHGYSAFKAGSLLPDAVTATVEGREWTPPPAERAWTRDRGPLPDVS